MNPVHQMQSKIREQFPPARGSEVFLESEYKSALGRVNFVATRSIFEGVYRKLGLSLPEFPNPKLVFFEDDQKPVAALYRKDEISFNTMMLESGLFGLRKRFPGLDESVLRELALVRSYSHEYIHALTHFGGKPKKVGFQEGSNWVGFNEVITELLAQYVFYEYVGSRIDLSGREKNVAYSHYAEVVSDLFDLAVELSAREVSMSEYGKNSVRRRVWVDSVKAFLSGSGVESCPLYLVADALGEDFVEELSSLGGEMYGDFEEDLILHSLKNRIAAAREVLKDLPESLAA